MSVRQALSVTLQPDHTDERIRAAHLLALASPFSKGKKYILDKKIVLPLRFLFLLSPSFFVLRSILPILVSILYLLLFYSIHLIIRLLFLLLHSPFLLILPQLN